MDKGAGPPKLPGKGGPERDFEPEMMVAWWRVKLDTSGEIRDFPDDRLEIIKEAATS